MVALGRSFSACLVGLCQLMLVWVVFFYFVSGQIHFCLFLFGRLEQRLVFYLS